MYNKDNFYTFNEYMKKEDESLTASMEDYLEMICRLSANTGYTRIHELSRALNVQPPSATKMVQKLAELKLLKYERYGVLVLCEEGKKLGGELLRRHIILENFIKIIGVEKADALQETEKMEHTISRNTLKCMENFIGFINENPDVPERLAAYVTLKNDIANRGGQ